MSIQGTVVLLKLEGCSDTCYNTSEPFVLMKEANPKGTNTVLFHLDGFPGVVRKRKANRGCQAGGMRSRCSVGDELFTCSFWEVAVVAQHAALNCMCKMVNLVRCILSLYI